MIWVLVAAVAAVVVVAVVVVWRRGSNEIVSAYQAGRRAYSDATDHESLEAYADKLLLRAAAARAIGSPKALGIEGFALAAFTKATEIAQGQHVHRADAEIMAIHRELGPRQLQAERVFQTMMRGGADMGLTAAVRMQLQHFVDTGEASWMRDDGSTTVDESDGSLSVPA